MDVLRGIWSFQLLYNCDVSFYKNQTRPDHGDKQTCVEALGSSWYVIWVSQRTAEEEL